MHANIFLPFLSKTYADKKEIYKLKSNICSKLIYTCLLYNERSTNFLAVSLKNKEDNKFEI